MDWSWWSSAGAFAVAMSATPGPNNAMIAASGANFGLRKSMPHALGICIGFPVMLLTVGMLGSPLINNPNIHIVLKWIGSIYLMWLAWKIGSTDPSPDSVHDRTKQKSKPLTLFQAAAFQWVNPKAWIIAASALATYVTLGSDSANLGIIRLSILFGIIAVPCVLLWTALGIGASRFLTTRKSLRLFNVTMALLLVASLILSFT